MTSYVTDCCSCGFPIEEEAICDRRLLIFVDFGVHFKVECFDGAHFGEGFEHIFFLNSSIKLVLLQHSMSIYYKIKKNFFNYCSSPNNFINKYF